ncbi:uncharacterized protein LOC129005610 [Macrosteles quadrilineatus]|uniref:uncharacterized protein LOC129005610 n=1 Tax=Macrosteles quadrilineatus TaxID=74068 RepID=UPI0023E0D99C|nr:uncharacterized protein LOC129005610 [Macrosteles quadrilineatus]
MGGGSGKEPKEDPNIDRVISLIKSNVEGFRNIYDSESYGTQSSFKPHCHPPNEIQKEITDFRLQLRESCRNTEAKPVRILAAALLNTRDEVKANIGKLATVKRDMRKQRQRLLPPLPKEVQNLEIPAEWSTTRGEDARPFLIFDTGKSSERAIAFGTEEAVKTLSRATQWYMDSTFCTSSDLFQQLYVIRGLKGDIPITCVYAFMTHKSTSLYVKVLESVVRYMAEIGVSPNLSYIMIDFEAGVINAVSKVFGNSVKAKCCFFHLCQNSWKHIQGLGLSSVYKSQPTIKLYCGMMDALAFLPVKDLSAGMLYLWSTAPVELADLLLYFEQTYVGGPVGSVVQATFPPSLWNMHEIVLAGHDKTNNNCEAWNRRFKELVGRQNPSFWTVVQALQKDEALERTKMLLPTNDAQESRKKADELQLRIFIREKCLQYNDGQLNIEDFLKSIGNRIRF